MTVTQTPSRDDPAWLGPPGIHWLLYAVTVLGVGLALASRLHTAESGPSESNAILRADGAHRVNPNTAAWWELAALPDVGKMLAQEIVAYRQARRAELSDPQAIVFRRLEDLQPVRGIGVVRAAALERMLILPDRESNHSP
jgi:DNA uptake protein ComE-like DNA-binding protein